MLHALQDGVRREDVDDPEVVYRVERRVRVVRRAQPAVVLVEQEVRALARRVFVGEDVRRGREVDVRRVEGADGARGFALARGGLAPDEGDLGLSRFECA